jgi:hypothetical protein
MSTTSARAGSTALGEFRAEAAFTEAARAAFAIFLSGCSFPVAISADARMSPAPQPHPSRIAAGVRSLSCG